MTSAEFDWSSLIQSARNAALTAHSPFSKFRVGAAVMDSRGAVFVGCNIESASFGLTICAERLAMFTAIAAGAGKLVRLTVTCLDAPETPTNWRMPCGACRQVMAELLEPDAAIYIDGVGASSIEELIPNAFKLTGR